MVDTSPAWASLPPGHTCSCLSRVPVRVDSCPRLHPASHAPAPTRTHPACAPCPCPGRPSLGLLPLGTPHRAPPPPLPPLQASLSCLRPQAPRARHLRGTSTTWPPNLQDSAFLLLSLPRCPGPHLPPDPSLDGPPRPLLPAVTLPPVAAVLAWPPLRLVPLSPPPRSAVRAHVWRDTGVSPSPRLWDRRQAFVRRARPTRAPPGLGLGHLASLPMFLKCSKGPLCLRQVPPTPAPTAHLPAPLLLECAAPRAPVALSPGPQLPRSPSAGPRPCPGVCGPRPDRRVGHSAALLASPAEPSPGKYLPDVGCPLGGCPHPGPRFSMGTGRRGGREGGPRNWSSLDCWAPSQTWGCPSPRGSRLSAARNSPRLGQVCQGRWCCQGQSRCCGQWGKTRTAAGDFPARSALPAWRVAPISPGALASSPGDRAAGRVHSGRDPG